MTTRELSYRGLRQLSSRRRSIGEAPGRGEEEASTAAYCGPSTRSSRRDRPVAPRVARIAGASAGLLVARRSFEPNLGPGALCLQARPSLRRRQRRGIRFKPGWSRIDAAHVPARPFADFCNRSTAGGKGPTELSTWRRSCMQLGREPRNSPSPVRALPSYIVGRQRGTCGRSSRPREAIKKARHGPAGEAILLRRRL